MVTVPSALRNPFSEERTLRAPRLRVEGRERGDSGPGPRSRAPGAGRWRPWVAPSRRRWAAAGRGRGDRALPSPIGPHPGGSARGTGTWHPGPLASTCGSGAPIRVPFPSPASRRSRPPHPGVPVLSHSWKRTRCPAKGTLTRGGPAPGAGRARRSAGGRCGCAAPAAAPAERPVPPPGSDFLFLALGPAARPRSPLAGRAPTRPSRRRVAGLVAASSGSWVPPPLGPGEHGGEQRERERERD